MIKCNVTIIGTITRGAEVRTTKDGKSFLSFGLQTTLCADSADKKTIDIAVAMDGNAPSQFGFHSGARVEIEGTLTLRKKEETVYYNLSCNAIKSAENAEDEIKGTMHFKGTLGTKGLTEKQGKKGAYRYFDAYSSEKDGDNYAYLWVHFIDFSPLAPDWLQPKTAIDAEGELEFSVFNGRESLNCRISTLALWDKTSNRQ